MSEVVAVILVVLAALWLLFRIPDLVIKHGKEPLIGFYSLFYERARLEEGWGEGWRALLFRFGIPIVLFLAALSLVT